MALTNPASLVDNTDHGVVRRPQLLLLDYPPRPLLFLSLGLAYTAVRLVPCLRNLPPMALVRDSWRRKAVLAAVGAPGVTLVSDRCFLGLVGAVLELCWRTGTYPEQSLLCYSTQMRSCRWW